MKIIIVIISCFFALTSLAQLEPVKSGVYKWASQAVTPEGSGELRNILKGGSPYFDFMEMKAVTQFPGDKPIIESGNDGFEECIIVKEGQMNIIAGGESQIIGPGGVFLVMPQTRYSIQNVGDDNLAYYEMRYRSRNKMDLERGQASGGSLILNADSLIFEPTANGARKGYFDRPTAMCNRFEMHVTRLDRKGPSHAPHVHAETEIILIISGDTEMVIDGKKYEATAGDFYLATSPLLHGIGNASDGPCTYFAFKWD